MIRAARAAAALAVVTAPLWIPSPYHLHVLIMAGIFAVLAMSLNVLLGYAGQLSLGHAAFFGIGAYASALLTLRLDASFWLGLPAGAIMAGLAGWGIGRLALQLRGAYFVLVTISFAGVISLVSQNWMALTNGPLGLPGIPAPELGPWSLRTKAAYYYLVIALAAAAYLLCRRLVRSRIGRAWLALRENEPLAEAAGVDPTRYLVLATVVSAGMAGVGGVLYAHYTRFVSPEVFLFGYTVTMVIMVVAGGKGTLAGPVVGAVLFTAFPEALREVVSWQWQMVLYGAILVLLVYFLPRGIVRERPVSPASVTARARRAESPTRDRQGAALVVSDLAVRFGGVAALDGVSFDVRPGTVTSLIGPNGAGKTTAFNAITGYLRPSRGTVTWAGAPITGLRPCAIARRGIVRTFQRTSVFPALSVHDNVMIGLHLRGTAEWPAVVAGRARVHGEEVLLREEAERVIARVGLSHRGRERAGALPYGEQRLIELAIALAADPALMLLDEPAAGMTGAEKDAVSRLILDIRDGGTGIFLVEHDMRLVMGISDRVLVLNHGRLIADGAPGDVRSDPAVIRAYLGSAAAPA